MFNLSYTTPCEIQGTILVKERIKGLGPITDIHGVRWDIHGIIGKYVQACRMSELHSHFTDTSGSSSFGGGTSGSNFVQQSWKPYNVEVVDE